MVLVELVVQDVRVREVPVQRGDDLFGVRRQRTVDVDVAGELRGDGLGERAGDRFEQGGRGNRRRGEVGLPRGLLDGPVDLRVAADGAGAELGAHVVDGELLLLHHRLGLHVVERVAGTQHVFGEQVDLGVEVGGWRGDLGGLTLCARDPDAERAIDPVRVQPSGLGRDHRCL